MFWGGGGNQVFNAAPNAQGQSNLGGGGEGECCHSPRKGILPRDSKVTWDMEHV